MPRAPNVLMLILDSVRADRVGSYGHDRDTMPTLDMLAAKGSRFERTYATGSWTVPVHASLFTGNLPHEHGSHVQHPTFDPDSEVLAEQLAELGYQTAAFSANPWFAEEFGFDAGFDHFSSLRPKLPFEDAGDPRENECDPTMDRVERIWNVLQWLFGGNPVKRLVNALYADWFIKRPSCSGSRINDAVEDWILSRSGSDPYFVCVNYMDAHEPYSVRAEYIEDQVDPRATDITWNHESLVNPPDQEIAADVRRIYDASLSLVDDHLENLLARLREGGHLEDTLVVVLGDHGQALGERGYWGHGAFLHESLLRVPMVLYHEDPTLLPADVVSDPVSVTWLHNYLKRVAEGVDFTDPSDESDVIYAESYGLDEERLDDIDLPPSTLSPNGYTAVVYRGWKGVRNRTTDEVEIHRVEEDPEVDRVDVKETITSLLRDVEPPSDGDAADMEVDPGVASRLEQLGYR